MDKGSEKIVIRNESSKNSFNVRDEMLKDSKDLLDSVEVTTIAAECQKLKALEDQIAAAEENLKDLKLKADDVGSRVIPELLAEQALTSIKMEDGSTVSVKKEFRATIPKDEGRREAALQWLRDQGLGDIIKNNVSVTFGKGEDDKAEQLLNLAAEHGFEPQQKSDVAWNTLTALYQERVQAGMDMPSECFSLWIKDKTKISRKK
jgi:hypothetical protein|tara:strand:- start:1241 stop:1855 length:615 start_codon:yes stop_codon:yes gene_type:complete